MKKGMTPMLRNKNGKKISFETVVGLLVTTLTLVMTVLNLISEAREVMGLDIEKDELSK